MMLDISIIGDIRRPDPKREVLRGEERVPTRGSRFDMSGCLRAVLVGRAELRGSANTDDPLERQWRSAFVKEEVGGPILVGKLGVEGDEQADGRLHGGPEKALLAYAAVHYASWRAELELEELGPGAFGENLSVDRWDEACVCIADVVMIGGLVAQVSQPRLPCWKLARRWHRSDIPARITRTGRSGWYLRVIEPGVVTVGDDVELVDRPFPEWTVARAFRAVQAARGEERLDLEGTALLRVDWAGDLVTRAEVREVMDALGD